MTYDETEDCQLYLHAWETIPTTPDMKRRFMGTVVIVSRCMRCGSEKIDCLDVHGNKLRPSAIYHHSEEYKKRKRYSKNELRLRAIRRTKRRSRK